MRYRILISLTIIFATLAVYWPVQNHGFVNWDDTFLIYENEYLSPPSIEKTLHYWTNPEWLYMPLTYTAWSILAWLSQRFPAEPYGLNPLFFHGASVLVHILSSFVIFSILRLLLSHGFKERETDKGFTGPSIELAAGAGALLFALHPVQVESVAWASELKDLLCGLFSFLAIRGYLLFAIASKTPGAAGKTKYSHYGSAAFFFVLALLSKPAAVVVPLVIFILDRWALKRAFKESATALIGWFIVAAGFAILTRIVQQSGIDLPTSPLWARPFIAGDALAFYLYKLIVPLGLGMDYGRSPVFVMQQWWLYLTWLFPLALAVGTLFLKKRVPLLVSFGVFAVSLLPVTGFVWFMFQFYSTVADHYLYMPMLGVVMAVSWTFLNYRTKPVTYLFIAALLIFGVRSSSQLSVWKNENALYLNTLKINPLSYLSHNNLGKALEEEGRLDKAALHFIKALEIRPIYSKAHYNMGNILKKQRKLDEAITYYKNAIRFSPAYADAYNNLGAVLNEKGDLNGSVYYYMEAIKSDPDDAKAYNNLGVTLGMQGKLDEAVAYFTKAIKRNPGYADAYNNLGTAMKNSGELDESVIYYKKAVGLQPDNAGIHYNLGIALSKQGKYKEAASHFSQAVRLRPDFIQATEQLEIAKAGQKTSGLVQRQ